MGGAVGGAGLQALLQFETVIPCHYGSFPIIDPERRQVRGRDGGRGHEGARAGEGAWRWRCEDLSPRQGRGASATSVRRFGCQLRRRARIVSRVYRQGFVVPERRAERAVRADPDLCRRLSACGAVQLDDQLRFPAAEISQGADRFLGRIEPAMRRSQRLQSAPLVTRPRGRMSSHAAMVAGDGVARRRALRLPSPTTLRLRGEVGGARG